MRLASQKDKSIVVEIITQTFEKNPAIMHVKRKLLFVYFSIFLLPFTLIAKSQDSARNGFYAETYLIRHDFSNGFVSLNYERILGDKQNKALRVGFYPDFESTVSFPVTFTWLTSPPKNHHFEFGVGLVFRVKNLKAIFTGIFRLPSSR